MSAQFRRSLKSTVPEDDRIAKDERLRRHGGALPSDSNTLGMLVSLTDERFHELLDDGTIHPKMKRNDMAVHAQDSLGRGGTFGGIVGGSRLALDRAWRAVRAAWVAQCVQARHPWLDSPTWAAYALGSTRKDMGGRDAYEE